MSTNSNNTSLDVLKMHWKCSRSFLKIFNKMSQCYSSIFQHDARRLCRPTLLITHDDGLGSVVYDHKCFQNALEMFRNLLEDIQQDFAMKFKYISTSTTLNKMLQCFSSIFRHVDRSWCHPTAIIRFWMSLKCIVKV